MSAPGGDPGAGGPGRRGSVDRPDLTVPVTEGPLPGDGAGSGPGAAEGEEDREAELRAKVREANRRSTLWPR